MATKKKSYYKPKGKQLKVTPELMTKLRADILKELKAEDDRKAAELAAERKVQETAHQKFLEEMYVSSEPWVEMQSWADTPQGVKVELEWNDAFVAYLKLQGIEGTDDDQTVQKWVALLLMQINDRMENPEDKDSKFE
jgi:hypothetical protein